MKSLFLVCLFLVFPVVAFAQFPISPNQFDENGLRTGHWTILYNAKWQEVEEPDSVIYYRLIRFDNGKPDGKVRDFYKNGYRQWDGYLSSVSPDVFADGEANYYHDNGKLQYKRYIVNQKIEGPYYEYSLVGKLVTKGNYRNDLPEGQFIFYYPDGQVQYEATFKQGVKQGQSFVYHPNGNIQRKINYKDDQYEGLLENFDVQGNLEDRFYYIQGKAQGPYQSYYSNRQLKAKGFFKNDQIDGQFISYFENGKIKHQGFYSKGDRVDQWIFYYENGSVESKGNYSSGQFEGQWEFYFENGLLSKRGKYINGIQEGEWLFYHDNGKLKARDNFRLGKYFGHSEEYYSNGILIAAGAFIDGNRDGLWLYYFENGKLKAEVNFRDGKRHGLSKFYFENGTIDAYQNFKHGELDGFAVNYYESGVVKDSTSYALGIENGKFRSYYPSGKLQLTATYSNGKYDGDTFYYYENGNLKSKSGYKNGVLHGPYIKYFENGNPSLQASSNMGRDEGTLIIYHKNGKRAVEKVIVNGEVDGPTTLYDSLSNRKLADGYVRNNKIDGLWKFYDAKGKVERLEYNILGFKETLSNVKDSIVRVMNRAAYDEALNLMPWFERVVKRDAKTKSEQAEPLLLYNRIYSKAGKYSEALKYIQLYLKIIERYEPSSENHKTAVHNLATAYHGLGQYGNALPMFDKAIEMESPKGLVTSYWSSINNKVCCLYDAKRADEASVLIEAELQKSFKKFGSAPGGWYIRHEAAEYYFNRPKDYSRSEKLFSDLLIDLYKYNRPNHESAFNAYLRLGKINEFRDSIKLAVQFYDSLITFAERTDMTLNPAYGERLVAVYNYYNRFTDSIAKKKIDVIISKMQKLAQRTVDHSLLAKLYYILQAHFYKQRLYNECVSYGELAENYMVKSSKEATLDYANVLQTQAWAMQYSDNRNIELSEEKFLKAVAIRKKLYGDNSFNYFGSKLILGSFYNSSKQYLKAKEVFDEVIPLLIKENNPNHLADAHKYLGETLYFLTKYAQSLVSLKIAYDYYRNGSSDHTINRILLLDKITNCYAFLKNYPQALSAAEEAYQLSLKQNGENSAETFSRVGGIGYIHQYFNAYGEALAYYQKQADGYKKIYGEKSDQYIETLVKVAAMHRLKDEPGRSLVLLLPYENIPADGLRAAAIYYVLDELAMDYAALKRFANEEKCRVRLLEISRKFKEGSLYAYQLNGIGEMYQIYNRFEEAEAYLTKALDVSRSTLYHNSADSWFLFSSLGKLKSRLDRNKEAEEYFLEALSIADSVNNSSGYKVSVDNLATFYAKMGRYRDAEKALETLSRFTERIDGKTFYYARLRAELVTIYYRQDEFNKARQEALSLVKFVEEEFGVTNWLALSLRVKLGNIAGALQEFEEARTEYELAIAGYNRIPKPTHIDIFNKAIAYNNLAPDLVNLGLLKEAEAAMVESERLFKITKEPLNMLGQLSVQRHWLTISESRGYFQQAELRWTKLISDLLLYIDDNFYYMSDEEKAQFWKSNAHNFTRFYSFAATRAKDNPQITGLMYNVQLATKAILLSTSNKIKNRILSSGDTAIVNMYYRWQQQRDQLAQLYETPHNTAAYQAKVDSVKTKINAIEKELNIAADDQLQDKGGSRVDWSQVRAVLKSNEAAVEIIRFPYFNKYERDSIIYAALVLTAETKNAPRLIILKDGKLLEGRALRFYKNSIAAKSADSYSFDSYWSALAEALKDKSKIYLSLDGVYNSINLNSIQTPDGRFLVDTKDFTLVSNTKDIISIKGKRLKRYGKSNASLIGFPSYFIGKEKVKSKLNTTRGYSETLLSEENRSGIADLPGTKVEIEKITQLLTSHQWKVTSYLDDQATENAIKDVTQPRVLHIATHGFFTDVDNAGNATTSDPMLRAGLLFSGAANFLQDHVQLSNDNGILTAYEAASLNLDNTDLVVLSACETGKGEVQNGEGVYGLQRAFQTAGAEAIIMSLWKVDDEATQELMSTFYQYWMDGKEKAEAFRLAQLQLKSKYQHPYYWGAFVMIGN